MAETRLQKRRFTFLPFMPGMTRELEDERMRRLFGDTFAMEKEAFPLGWYPPVEVVENKDEFVLTAELPGLKKEEVDLAFEKDVLTLKGEKTEELKEADPDKRYHLFERNYGAFQRSFTFPATVNATKILAEFKEGILTVHLPKTTEAKVRGQKIEIVTK
jgi:HSP20 family protein